LFYFLPVLVTLLSSTYSSDSTCEVLDIAMCKFTNYTSVRLPNELGHKTQNDARLELDHFKSLISTNCSADLQLFLCTLYAPICDTEKGPDFHIKPCRTMCLNVRDRCLPIMKNNSFDWPNSFKCGRFSENSMCVKGSESALTTEPPATPVKIKTTTKPKAVTVKPTAWIEPNNRCRSDQLFCDNTCIPLQFRCDDVIDCKEDGLDEKNCDKCLTNQFRCESGEKCIAALNKCDGFSDCEDGSDERDCGLCSGSEFQCDKDRCIPKSLVCNNHKNCADGTDEKQCGICPTNSHTCGNGRCISQDVLCDGQDDCGDNSDETDASCYDVQPTKKPDYCANFFQKCEFQDSCSNALTNYRAQCDALINGHSQTQCTKECQTAYYGLKSNDPIGIGMIKMQCEQIHVTSVEDKCIRNPPTHNCLNEVTNCQKTKRCAHLYSMYNTHCENTLNNHDQCSAGCSSSYNALIVDPTAVGLVRECNEISETIKIACSAQELRSSSYHLHYSTFLLLALVISLI